MRSCSGCWLGVGGVILPAVASAAEAAALGGPVPGWAANPCCSAQMSKEGSGQRLKRGQGLYSPMASGLLTASDLPRAVFWRDRLGAAWRSRVGLTGYWARVCDVTHTANPGHHVRAWGEIQAASESWRRLLTSAPGPREGVAAQTLPGHGGPAGFSPGCPFSARPREAGLSPGELPFARRSRR